MSVRATISIVCDECGQSVTHNTPSVRLARKTLRESGWIRSDKRKADVCPVCIVVIKKTRKYKPPQEHIDRATAILEAVAAEFGIADPCDILGNMRRQNTPTMIDAKAVFCGLCLAAFKPMGKSAVSKITGISKSTIEDHRRKFNERAGDTLFRAKAMNLAGQLGIAIPPAVMSSERS